MPNRFSSRNMFVLSLVMVIGLGLAATLTSMASAGRFSFDPGSVTQNEEINAPDAPGAIIRVAKSGDGSDGSTWENAYTDIQTAITAAVSGDEIWVAKGIYTPGLEISDTFQLKSGVAIFGGFAATETIRSERDWDVNLTILSGDIDGDDTVTNGVVLTTTDITGDNSIHVLYAFGHDPPITETTVLDGFTITAGQADGSNLDQKWGAGFYCYGSGDSNECSPTLENVTFSGNYAIKHGGAMLNNGNAGNSSPILRKVTFIGNWADERGGALYNLGTGAGGTCSPDLSNVSFITNTAVKNGGAVYNEGINNGTSNPTMTNIIFSGNSSTTRSGGAVYNDGSSSGESSPLLSNVVFSGNSAAQRGGAMVNNGESGNSSPTFINVTFSGNSAKWQGGVMYNTGVNGFNNPRLINSIVWNNLGKYGDIITNHITGTIYNYTATVFITQSLVQGAGVSGSSWISGTYLDGGGNIDEDPVFLVDIDPSTAPTTTGNLRLQTSSPAIDAGENDYVLAGVVTDLDGKARIQDGNADGDAVVDMGAYETGGFFLLSVTKSGGGSGLVTSSPPGIDCGETCSKFFMQGSKITLSAVPDENSVFSGWSGACGRTGDCEVAMDAANSVEAVFEKKYSLIVNLTGRGIGVVTSQPAGINCGGNCQVEFPQGTQVTLTASADPGSTFTGWSGDCSGGGICSLNMDVDKTATANFEADIEIILPIIYR